MKHVTPLCLVTVLRRCLVCVGLDSVLVGKLSELSHLSSWANRVSEALLSHLNDTNPLRAVATAIVQGLTCISQKTLKGTEVCSVLPEPWRDWQARLIGILNTLTFRIVFEGSFYFSVFRNYVIIENMHNMSNTINLWNVCIARAISS